jgi:inhibitor of cysteine peptidase
MKKLHLLGLIPVLLLPFLILGCTSEEPPAPEMPALHGGQEAKMVEISCDDFMAQPHITRDVELIRPGSLIVSLCANPTTGFQWGETAEISDPSVVAQQSHNFVEPQAGNDGQVVGAPGKDVWVFDSRQEGTATIKMSYSRPWEGGEKDEWTLTLNITVK